MSSFFSAVEAVIDSSVPRFVDDRAGAGGIGADGNAINRPQMIVNNLPKHIAKNDLEKHFKSIWNIKYHKIKFVPQKTFCFVVFDNDAELDAALSILKKVSYKNRKLEPEIRRIEERSSGKRKFESDDAEKSEDTAPVFGAAKDAVAPWWNVPYEEQLTRKQDTMQTDCVDKMINDIRSSYTTSYNSPISVDNLPLYLRAHPLPAAPTSAEGEASSSTESSTPSVEKVMNYKQKRNKRTFPKLEAEKIIPSPSILGYRNKCELTFGVNTKMEEILGFRVSATKNSYATGQGKSTVDHPYDCPNVPRAIKMVAAAFTHFLRDSPFRVYDSFKYTGVWRQLTLRYGKKSNELSLLLCVSIRSIEMSAWVAELKRLTRLLMSLPHWKVSVATNMDEEDDRPLDAEGYLSQLLSGSASCTSTSLPTDVGDGLVTGFGLQVFEGVSVPFADHPVIHIFGKEYVTEQLLGCSYQISSQAFFQVNTPGAEVLFTKAFSFLSNSSDTKPSCLLDICCGTGTIGICAANSNDASGTINAHGIQSVIGIDICPSAIEDAKKNATMNNLQVLDTGVTEDIVSTSSKATTAWVASRAELVLDKILFCRNPSSTASDVDKEIFKIAQLTKNVDLCAIVDPPREGMHFDCLRAIRNCSRIKRLVYISCNPLKSLIRDSIALCGPISGKLTQNAFQPVVTVPVDMFPLTPHCEMIAVFERMVGTGDANEITGSGGWIKK